MVEVVVAAKEAELQQQLGAILERLEATSMQLLHAERPAAEEEEHLGVAMPVYEPGFTPLAIFDGSFRSSLQRIMRSKRKLSATATAYQVVVGGVSDKVAQFDLGQGVGDLHPLDFSCFYFNLQRDVSRRLAAFVCRRDGPRAAL